MMTTAIAEPCQTLADADRPTGTAAPRHRCRFCDAPLSRVFVDLGMSPLCESFLSPEQLDRPETFYPLRVYVCDRCLLVQLPQYVSAADIFSEYAYFSSYSDSWLRHARRFSERMIERFGLTADRQVIEIASNDGYLLQNFVRRGIPALGIEPAANVARAAIDKGVPTLVRFFGAETARELRDMGQQADLLVANNVLAHVPELNDFVAGVKLVLSPEGIATFEFPHLLRLMAGHQFDTIYHEHFCYLSLLVVERLFAAHGLSVFDVEELPSHGGSLRVFAQHADGRRPRSPNAASLRQAEVKTGLGRPEGYAHFADEVVRVKHRLLELLAAAKRQGHSIAGYGAPGKGNTLLNYCGIRTDFIDYTVDRNPYKHGKYLPGTHVPIYSPERIAQTRPDLVFVLPWNLRGEIVEQLAYIREWGGRFIVPIPEPEIF